MNDFDVLEIYDEREFEVEKPKLFKNVQKKIDDRYEFAFCMQEGDGEDINVVYHNIFNTNETANFVFDDEGHLIDFEIEED